jgi:preprotein translocase subunit SecG
MMLFLQQQGPANTVSYMILGYAVIFIVISIYLASLAIRSRNLRQDLEVLKDLERKEK